MTWREARYKLQRGLALTGKESWDLNKYIESLEQQPCEDCISRKAELDGLASIAKAKAKSDAQKALMGRVMFFTEQLPSVTPKYTEEEIDRAQAVEQAYIDKMVELRVEELKRPTGHNCNEDYADCDQFVCSECGIELQDWHRVERDLDDGDVSYHEYTFRFCPNCGARMIESEG